MFSRLQLSTIEMIAATRGPACGLPMWIQFFRLWKDFQRRLSKFFHERRNWIHIGSEQAVLE